MPSDSEYFVSTYSGTFPAPRQQTTTHARPASMLVLALVLIATLGLSCVTIGHGTRTVIKHKTSDAFLQEMYPHLITNATASDADRVAHFKDGQPNSNATPAALRDFHAFMQRKYSAPNFVPLALTATVRDRTTIPTFLPVDFRKHLAAVLLANTSLELTERRRRFTILVNQPDLYNNTTQHIITSDGIPAYRYFPRVSVDFGSHLLSASPLDRLSFLLMVIRLRGDGSDNDTSLARTDANEHIRFLDFSPKEADFVDFTRGQFTQALQAAVSASASAVDTVGVTTTEPATSQQNTQQDTIGFAPNLTISESYATALRDAIERRSTGLLDSQTFYAAFRSLREVRIGGTYNFDFMLEVPSTVGFHNDTMQSWEPIADTVRADIYMIGVCAARSRPWTYGYPGQSAGTGE